MTTDLDRLIEAVEAGNNSPNWMAIAGYSGAKWGYCERAFNGSVDAAITLCETLLPGWKVAGLHQEDRGFGGPNCAKGTSLATHMSLLPRIHLMLLIPPAPCCWRPCARIAARGRTSDG